MLVVAHKMQVAHATADDFAAAGADVFEIDLQLAGTGLVSSHAIPLFSGPALLTPLRHDGRRFSWSREPIGDPLATILSRVPAGARALLDLKSERGTQAFTLAARVAAAGLDPARILASSKHWSSLSLVAEAGFGIWRSVSSPFGLRRLLAQKERVCAPAGSGVTIRHPYLTRELVAELKRFGLVVAWTVNDVRLALRLVEWGVDGVTTDRPEVMRAVRAASSP